MIEAKSRQIKASVCSVGGKVLRVGCIFTCAISGGGVGVEKRVTSCVH